MSGEDIVLGENNGQARALFHGNKNNKTPLRPENTKTITDIESDCSLFTLVYRGEQRNTSSYLDETEKH